MAVATAVVWALLLVFAARTSVLWRAHTLAVVTDTVVARAIVRAVLLVGELTTCRSTPSWVTLALSFPADTML